MAADGLDAVEIEGGVVGFVQVLADEGLQQFRIVTNRVDDPRCAITAEHGRENPVADPHLVEDVAIELESRIVAGEIAIGVHAGQHYSVEGPLGEDAGLARTGGGDDPRAGRGVAQIGRAHV